MSVDRKEIDLIIRAALQGGKTLDGVTKSITDIEKALDAQTAAAKRGESSIDDLKATLLSLQRAQDQLKDQAGLIGQFDRLATQIKKSEERAAQAVKTYNDFKDKLDKAGTATDKQAEKLLKLATSSERWQTTLAKQRVDQEALTATLRESGVEIDRLGEAENRARQAAAQLGITINRTQQAIASYSEDVRKARIAEQALADEQTFQKKLVDAAKLNKAGEYVRFWTNALNAADASEKQLQINTALRKTADEAVAAARGFKTLGSATRALQQPSASLRDVIAGIIDPAAQARTTLAGVEAEVKKIGSAVSAIKGPISDYREQVQQLAAAQRVIGEQASLVDAFTRQKAALNAAGVAYRAARDEVLRLAEATRNSSGKNEQLSNSLRAAQGVLASSQGALQKEIEKFRELRAAMQAAGLSTKDMEGTQARLTSVVQNATNALKGLESAHHRYGDAVRGSGNAHSLLNDGGRTTLSLFQRMRGEILALAASYVGIFGTINFASKIIEAFNVKQQALNQLAIGTGGDKGKAAEEFAFIAAQVDRLGLNLQNTTKAYAKFSTAATFAGRSHQETRFIFESVAEVGRVAGLTKDQLDHAFFAIGQMYSKGRVQAEEFNQQLGEVLPGLTGVAKKALPQFADFNKAMKDGKVTLNDFVLIMAKYRELVSGQLPEAITSLAAEQERFNTEISKFQLLIAEKGFAKEYRDLLAALTEFFKSKEGQEFAQGLSDKLSLIARGLKFIVENAETVKDVLIAGVFILGAKMAAGLGIALVTLQARMAAVALTAGTAGLAVRALQTGFLAFAAAIVGWEIGKILSDKFAVVRRIGIAMVLAFEAQWAVIKFGFEVLWAVIEQVAVNGLAHLVNLLTLNVRVILGLFSKAASAVGMDAMSDSIDKVIASLTIGTVKLKTTAATLLAQLKNDLLQIKKIGGEMWDEAGRPKTPALGSNWEKVGGGPATTPFPAPGKTTPAVLDGKAAERRLHAKEALEAELKAIEARIEKNEKDSLEHRIAGIILAQETLMTKIKNFGRDFGTGPEIAAMTRQLQGFIDQLIEQETRNFNKRLLAEQSELENKIRSITVSAGKGQKTDLQVRLNAVRDQYEKHYAEIAALRAKLVENKRDTAPAERLKAELDAGIATLTNLEQQKFHEDEINALLEERKAKLDVIAARQKAGEISAATARELTKQTIAETQPKIVESVEAGLAFVETMREAAIASGASTTALDALKAKLLEARESAKQYKTELITVAELNDILGRNAVNAFTSIAEAIGKAIVKMDTWRGALRAAGGAFVKFSADVLMELGKMILKAQLLKLIEGSGNWMSMLFGFFVNMGSGGSAVPSTVLAHSGGMAGPGLRHRTVNPLVFANATRYHGGGVAGLLQNEIPAILQRNEEVLTTADPRHVMNGGKFAGGAAAQDIKVINMIDSASVISEGLSTQAGTRAIVNFISANRTEVKAVLGV